MRYTRHEEAARIAPVSVVMPTYQRATMLREAIDSVLGQTVDPAELIVVDDGSTDDTKDVVSEAEARAAGRVAVRLLSRPHSGSPGRLRNEGAALASGEWLVFLDSDDIWLAERLERQLLALSSTPGAGFALCGIEGFDERGRVDGARLIPPRSAGGWILGDVLEGTVCAASSLMIRRDIFKEMGGFRETREPGEDYELSLRLAARWPASHVAEVLVLKRLHAGSSSVGDDSAGLTAYLRTVDQFVARHPGLDRAVRRRADHGRASAHLKLARLATRANHRRLALRHVATAAGLRPLDRRLPAAFWSALLSR